MGQSSSQLEDGTEQEVAHPVISSPPSPIIPGQAKASQAQKYNFLTVPLEIRIIIYELLLVRPAESSGSFRPLVPWGIWGDAKARLQLAILQTCKQVHHEATATLYSRNIIEMNRARVAVDFLETIGPTNTGHLRSLVIDVPHRDGGEYAETWLRMLDMLEDQAKELRVLEVEWQAFIDRLYPPDTVRGLGDNVSFVRALARMRGLEKLRISGYYAKRWPAYLEDKLGGHGVKLRVDRGSSYRHHQELCPYSCRRFGQYGHRADGRGFDMLAIYQKGTEDVDPNTSSCTNSI